MRSGSIVHYQCFRGRQHLWITHVHPDKEGFLCLYSFNTLQYSGQVFNWYRTDTAPLTYFASCPYNALKDYSGILLYVAGKKYLKSGYRQSVFQQVADELPSFRQPNERDSFKKACFVLAISYINKYAAFMSSVE